VFIFLNVLEMSSTSEAMKATANCNSKAAAVKLAVSEAIALVLGLQDPK